VKLSLSILALLFPLLGHAQVAGDWVGAHATPSGGRHVVLHITGPDTALKANWDSPDQRQYDIRIDSISFSDSTLSYGVSAYDIQYSGVLNSEGKIEGTLTQHGASVSLVFARSDNAARVFPPKSNLASGVENGTFHHAATGVEFDLPVGWSYARTNFNAGNDGPVAILKDSSGKATFAQVWMMKVRTKPENMPRALDGVIQHERLNRSGAAPGAEKREIPGYKIPDDSVRQTLIGGQPAMLAIGEYQRNGKNYADLLAWVFSENTRTHFIVSTKAEDLASVQATFEQMLQSMKMP
jgi:hypothetical protein